MGPRPFGRGRRTGLSKAAQSRLLQWGRDLSVAEGCWRCRPTAPRCRRFNGAATFRSRKAVKDLRRLYALYALQWGRDLSVAEGDDSISRTPSTGRASMGPRPFGRGRRTFGAADYLAHRASMGPRPFGRGRQMPSNIRAVHGQASMGPRPFGRGRQICAVCRPKRGPRFNGAATFRSRKAAADLSSGLRSRCFNGAATFRSRKDV